MPSNRGRTCALTNEDIIALGCITTQAMNTNNVFIFTSILISHGFLRHGYSVRKKTHIHTKGIGVIIHALHELSLRARGTQVQISQQPLHICNSAWPIQTQTTTCLPEQTFHLTLHSGGNHTTTPFEVLLGFCKLLQAAVSKPIMHSTHTCSITNAKGNQCNSMDLFYLYVVNCSCPTTVCTIRKEVAASPLPSWGPKRGRNCYATPAFSGVPNVKRGEQNQKWSPTKGNKIRSGCLTPAFSGSQKRAEMHVTPTFSGIPNKGEQNQKWLPHPCLLGGPKEGGNAMSPLHSRGSPTPSAGSKISGYLNPAFSGVPKEGDKIRRAPEEGTKSKVATSPQPPWGSS